MRKLLLTIISAAIIGLALGACAGTEGAGASASVGVGGGFTTY